VTGHDRSAAVAKVVVRDTPGWASGLIVAYRSRLPKVFNASSSNNASCSFFVKVEANTFC
jgi:hypothetical protein